MTRRMPIRLLSAALAGTMLAGCGGGHRDGGDVTEDVPVLEAQLRAKPPFEDAQEQYAAALSKAADAIAALVPGLTWQFKEKSWRGCTGKFVKTDGKQAYVYVVMDRAIPDDTWPQALQIVKDTAAGFGASDLTVLLDKVGDHDVYLTGADGVELEFGTKANTILSALSDCRLPQNQR